ncbi:hypothetical protein B0H11DRAFT_1909401 [Mycena galericulata]|nr:hypothetical protein B0H11DRAFT_1909401 [Mycena galericulata]
MDGPGPSSSTTIWTNESTLPCPQCLRDVPVGTGGESNLQRHIGSAKCNKNKNEKLKKTTKNASLFSYLVPKVKVPLVPPTVAAPAPVKGPRFIPVTAPNDTGPEPLEELDLEMFRDLRQNLAAERIPVSETCIHALTLLRQLRAKLTNIPAHSPLANSMHPLASFAVNPAAEYEQRNAEDDWDQILHPMLRRAFGQGELDPVLSGNYINLGEYGLSGFCAFFESYITEREVKGHQLMPYFEFLIQGIEIRFPSSNDSVASRLEPRVVYDELHRALPTASEDYALEVQKTVTCVGIQLGFPRGRSHHVDYPFGLHQHYDLPWDYYSQGDKKIDQTRSLKLTKLNVVRKLLGKMAALDDHKQFVMAIASGRVERVAQLVQACLNNGVGIRGLLERYQSACQMVYNPKGFTEDDTMLGLLILRLGGARLAGIVHRAKGLPGLSTLRKHTVIRPLRASPGMPTVQEIEDNIDAFAEAEPESTGVPVIVHRILMMDEIAVEQRPRWDDKTNMILGACRECSHKVSLELNTADDLEVFFNALDDGEIHLACEATVAAFGALSKDPRVYSPRPCCISGTDKHEKGPEQANFIQQIMTAGHHKRVRGNITYRTISIASDGEAKRGAALVQKTMNRDLDSDSPIHKLLIPLDLMNFRVGEDDLTADKDYRHVLKTLRNLLMRLKGVKVLGFVITPAIIKQHLRAAGHSQEQVDAFLNPNDKQDVYLGYQLLKAMWSLPVAPAESSPGFIRTRKALRMFGQLGYHLLMPYIFIDLSLHQQLVHLSTAAHLLLILYSDEKAGTSFMANQTFGNLMIMIKNVFFCIAKTKIDIPDAEFFIILLGTDRLEVLFGLIRTAIGTDVNVDMYQLSTRASNLTEATIILANRPHWDRSPRRLKLPMIINEAGDISPNADHITPAAWKGDVRVQNINLWTAWKQGRQIAEELIPQGRAILTVCSSTPGVDIFSPLGTSLINYLDEDVSEDFDIDPSLLSAPHADTSADTVDSLPLVPPNAESSSTEDSSYTPDGDVEDALAIAEPQGKFSPEVEINGKLISKARALSGMMRYRGSRSSTDRLKRVAGLPSFNPSMEGTGMISDSSLGAASLRVGNPVAVVVSCEEQLFLAVAQVNNIKLASSPVQSIALDMLLDSSAKISVQILRLVPATIADDPTEKNDWRWSLSFEATCTNLPGNLIHPVNPAVSVQQAGEPTYLFDSSTLVTAAATIHDQMLPRDFMGVPKVARTPTFPYRHQGQHNGQRVLEHMGAHILFDPQFTSALQQPCGACLRSSPMCSLYYKPRRGTSAARQVDWALSTTGPFTYKSSDKNHPHVAYEISIKERRWMEAKWKARFGNPVKYTKKKGKSRPPLQISEAHSSRMALRQPTVDDVAQESEDQLPDDTENTSTNYSTPNSVFAVLQDDEDDFGDELPPALSPALVPTDDDEYSEEFPEGIAAQMDDMDDEIPPSEFPPGSADFVAAQPLEPRTAQQDWDLPLVDGQPTRSRLKRRIYETSIGMCECDKVVTAAERADSKIAVRCSRAGCETDWYHLSCLGHPRVTKTWILSSTCLKSQDVIDPDAGNEFPT